MMTVLPAPAGLHAWVVTDALTVTGPHPVLAIEIATGARRPESEVSALRLSDPIRTRFLLAFPGYGATASPWVRGHAVFFSAEAAEAEATEARLIEERLLSRHPPKSSAGDRAVGPEEERSARFAIAGDREFVAYLSPRWSGGDEPSLVLAIEASESDGELHTDEAIRLPANDAHRVQLALLALLGQPTSEEAAEHQVAADPNG